ncbi:MAG TPA: glycosyltransferase family 39 protein [Elusimicrobiota bacterium]|nr:glycosyltransferase family 39 protein [Elusimicrobiota bacterium]
MLGFLARVAWVVHDRAAAPHPDLMSFHPSQLPFTHPFDTSPREPFYVWWLWILGALGADSTAAIRLLGTLWFLPNAFLLFQLVRRHWDDRTAWGALGLFAVLPGQIVSDGLGLRHLMETAGVLLFLTALRTESSLESRRTWLQAAGAFAALVLTRVTYAVPGGIFLTAAAFKNRRWRPILAGLPAALLLCFHLANNQRRNGDALYSINLHSYWYANLEFVGRPGFPATEAERQRDVYRPSLNFRRWAFEAHTPAQYLAGTIQGYGRIAWTFFAQVYYRVGLPALLTGALLALHLWGLLGALGGTPGRVALAAWVLLNFPYAFVGHVFWAGRFFVPFAPLALGLLVAGARDLTRRARAGWASFLLEERGAGRKIR